MELPVVMVKDRPLTGKGVARKIRALGHVPAVLYGKGIDARSLVLEPSQLVKVLQTPLGSNSVIQLEFDDGKAGDGCLAMIKAHDIHPFRRHLLHCDFIRVDEKDPPKFHIPIRIVGKSEGEKAGAKLNIAMREIVLKCSLDNIPEAIDIDVTPLEIGEKLMLSELTFPEGAVPVSTKDMPVVTVRMGRIEKEVEEEVPEGEEGEIVEGAEAAGEDGAAATADGEAETKPDSPES